MRYRRAAPVPRRQEGLPLPDAGGMDPREGIAPLGDSMALCAKFLSVVPEDIPPIQVVAAAEMVMGVLVAKDYVPREAVSALMSAFDDFIALMSAAGGGEGGVPGDDENEKPGA